MEQTNSLPFMEKNIQKFDRYILQIDRNKLQDYINCGLITPDRYLGDEIEKDIQSKNPNFLVLSNGYIEELDEYQILIDLILTDREKEQLQQANTIYYLDTPLPITRIKKIYIQDQSVINHIVQNIDTSESGFLPKNLFDTYRKNDTIQFQQNIYNRVSEEIKAKEYAQEIINYDKRLGMFSFMRNVGVYYSNSSNTISNYSENYFAILSTFLAQTLENGSLAGLDILKESEEFKSLLYSNKQMDEKFIENIAHNIKDEEIKNIFSKILEPNQKRKTLPLLLERDAYLYYFIALVYYFRQKESNRKDNFKIDFETLIPKKVSETAFAILGIYLGYKNLRASETYALTDEKFSKIFGSTFAIKFKLDSKLDYVTIESIYQYCFNKKGKIEIPDYLKYPPSTQKFTLPKDKIFKTWYKVEEKCYLEAPYIKIRKKSAMDIILLKLEKYNDEIVFGKDYLASYIAKYFKNLIYYSKNGEPCKPFCKKDEFLEAIAKQNEQNKILELLNIFEVDKK